MKMHCYFLLNIKHGASHLYLGANIQLRGLGGGGICEAAGGGRGLFEAPGAGGPQLSSSALRSD